MMIESPPSPHSQRKPSVTFSLPDTPRAEEEDEFSLLSPIRSPTIDICAHAVPNTVLVAMLDRPEEMRQLVQHNRAFFAALRSHLHTAWPRFENTLYCSRTTMPDRDWLDRISKALRGAPSLLQQFCDLVGYVDVEPQEQESYFEYVDITRIRNHPDRLNSKSYPQFYINCRECMNQDDFEKFQQILQTPRSQLPDDVWEMSIYDQLDRWPNLIAQLREIIAYETEQKDAREWQKPYSTAENLEGSCKCLDSAVGALAESVHSLKNITSDFARLSRVTAFDRTHEIVTEADIRLAQSAIASRLVPEIDALLDAARAGLEKLAKEEHDMELKVDYQMERIRQLQALTASTSSTHRKRSQRQQSRRTSSPLRRGLMDARREALKKELAELEAKVDLEASKVKSAREARERLARQREEREREIPSHAAPPPSSSSSPSTTEPQELQEQDIQLLKQLKTFCKILLPANNVGIQLGQYVETLATTAKQDAT